MIKTRYTLARHTSSEEYLKVKTKLKQKYLQKNVKSDVLCDKMFVLL